MVPGADVYTWDITCPLGNVADTVYGGLSLDGLPGTDAVKVTENESQATYCRFSERDMDSAVAAAMVTVLV
jgi:hypothetical protein